MQDKTAMRISTDSILLGAWCRPEKSKTILDIGTGTGVVALMLAQRSQGKITAIDIDINSCQQAEKNFNNSAFNNTFIVEHCSLQNFVLNKNHKFDLIVSNPPYFTNSKPNPDSRLKNCRHDNLLSKEELFHCVSQLLDKKGVFNIILPYEQKAYTLELAERNRIYPSRITNAKPSLSKAPKRILIEFLFHNNNCIEDEIAIEKAERHNYTDAYIELTKDYYLFIPEAHTPLQ